MSTSKSQRLVNLVICLMSRQQYISAEAIASTVQGYEDSANHNAFLRTFERDKAELEKSGIRIDVGETPEGPLGYLIHRADIELPPIEPTPRAAAVLAVVGEVWSGAARNAELSGALTKLRAAGIRPELGVPVEVESDAVDSGELTVAAEFAELSTQRKVATFSHAAVGAETPRTRTLEPWLVGSQGGHWYVVGHDRDRDGVRCFRLSRVAEVKAVTSGSGATAAAERPPIPEVQRILESTVRAFDPVVDAWVWVANGVGAVLRSRAASSTPTELDGVAGEELEIPGITLNAATELVAGAGSRAVALAPESLVDSVVSALTAAKGWAS
ncbi:helix-turn-helix transcriptional regulator [Dietzia sp.]|uniref:helix-turn-helix transcriptional regulator n=1 Tax=Dietzia sp. TaxID=1871616 RepID=UPI002FD8F4B8